MINGQGLQRLPELILVDPVDGEADRLVPAGGQGPGPTTGPLDSGDQIADQALAMIIELQPLDVTGRHRMTAIDGRARVPAQLGPVAQPLGHRDQPGQQVLQMQPGPALEGDDAAAGRRTDSDRH